MEPFCQQPPTTNHPDAKWRDRIGNVCGCIPRRTFNRIAYDDEASDGPSVGPCVRARCSRVHVLSVFLAHFKLTHVLRACLRACVRPFVRRTWHMRYPRSDAGLTSWLTHSTGTPFRRPPDSPGRNMQHGGGGGGGTVRICVSDGTAHKTQLDLICLRS